MLVSVIMITYNHEKYIEKAVESVLSQIGNFDIELLIGNDKSPDNTKKILEKYKNDKRVKIFNREVNLGATKNEIDLKMRAKGDYVAILEGDDYWIDNYKIDKQLEILKNNKEAILVYSDSYVINEKNEIIGKKVTKNKRISNFKSLMANKNEIPAGTIIYKNIFKNNIEIKKIKKLLQSSIIVEDFPLFAMLIKKGKFIKLEKFTGAYRYITDSNISTSYSSRSNLFKEFESYKASKGIYEYYVKFNFYRWCMVKRRENSLIREIKKSKENVENYLPQRGLKDKLNLFLYRVYKPIDNLVLSFYKNKYSKEGK